MIESKGATKRFDKFTALDNLNCKIKDASIYGLVGANGAGKSTFLRLLSGIYKCDLGQILIDGQKVYENTEVKNKIAFIPDELHFLPQATINKMAKFYNEMYKDFNTKRYNNLVKTFRLNPDTNINTFSKGMKRQAATILALSCMPKYLFFDETFDGLDPVMRNLVKEVIYNDSIERGTTTIITSHSLRELEDTCDQLSLLYKGGIVFESDTENLKTSLFKVQIAFNEEYTENKFTGIEIIKYNQKGSVANFIVRGDKNTTVDKLTSLNPVLLEVLPLSLEEVFIYEMEALGYAFKEVDM